MTDDLRGLLMRFKAGELDIDELERKLKLSPFQDIEYANVDLHRKLRQGASEVIYGSGKTAEQIAGIIETLKASGQSDILITRLDADKARLVSAVVDLEYFEDARIGVVGHIPEPEVGGQILVITAGTSDIPVAEEAAITAQMMGNSVARIYDVGVAGIHRLFARLDDIAQANVIIAVAGMEGALVSVIGGIAECPVIAVPTSVGYGSSFGGLAALLAMLNSCSSGVAVVNIDNGFGAGCMASKINHLARS